MFITWHDLKSHRKEDHRWLFSRVTADECFCKSGNIDGITGREVRQGRDRLELRIYRYRQSRGKPLRAVSEAYRSRAARTPKQGEFDPFNCRDNVGIRVKTHQTSAGNDYVQELPLPFSHPTNTRVSDLAPFWFVLYQKIMALKCNIDIGRCHFPSYSGRSNIADSQFDRLDIISDYLSLFKNFIKFHTKP